jgi:hypothetical protein
VDLWGLSRITLWDIIASRSYFYAQYRTTWIKVCLLLSTAVVYQVTVMIATDGESSDGNVADALRPLTNVSAILRG